MPAQFPGPAVLWPSCSFGERRRGGFFSFSLFGWNRRDLSQKKKYHVAGQGAGFFGFLALGFGLSALGFRAGFPFT
ncbi:hypothetical protein PACTADRAFT_50273 [Pachysolen tannophilus NRRL Y-2460]|uniref:Uncharacterized protein n=1 Tax=Pachysolen tannophilus NRRL Y-2460 TaxID=669874 RepID=A0A1E4TV17_PACTA|nr:hypothetical protein PACTADRAFT_50273 [Pachysolen tannophilus NRRL Y-2460]